MKNAKKKGKRNNRQRYICLSCNQSFQTKAQPDRQARAIWKKYVWQRKTLGDLAKEYRRSINWIKKQIALVEVPLQSVNPQSVVIIVDSTFYRRIFGIMTVRVPKLKKNIYWREIGNEKIEDYLKTRIDIEKQGWTIKAVVLDGRPGARKVFEDIPIQMCQFHQKQIINRKLTMRPKLPASIELRELTNTLTLTDEKTFSQKLDRWYECWSAFLKEKTFNPINPRKWEYTHKRVRSAYYSLKTNLPYLFTCQKYPELRIPNTTNSLDGYFAHLKELTKLHRGLNKETKRKMIDEILSKIDPRI